MEANVRAGAGVGRRQTLSDALEAFQLYGRIEGKSRKTLEVYRVAFGDLIGYVGDVEVTDLKAGDVRRWIAHKLDGGYSKTTVNIRLRALRACFNWLYREGQLQANPFEHVRQLRTPRQYPRVLSEAQVLALLKAARQSKTWVGKRNLTMVLTFLDGMLRLRELIDLELADVNLQARSLRVRHGKGDRERIVYIGRRLTRAMRDWLVDRGHVVGCDNIFTSRSGERLDPRNVQRILGRLGAKAGIEARVSPHVLRHTGATLFIRNGGDAFSLQQLLGHSSITTTQIYVHMAGTALREAHAKASPVDRLLGG
jgi:integrase/recombinase XerD